MRPIKVNVLLLILLLVATTVNCQDITEGGNITDADLEAPGTLYWAAIVGWLNGTDSSTLTFVSYQDVNDTRIFVNSPNGTYARLENATLTVTRLPFKPNISDISTPTPSDFNDTGMFSGFGVFSGIDYNGTLDSPLNTFCNPCSYTTCILDNTVFVCPYIVLNPDIIMGVLKFSNGTHEEPIFVGTIDSTIGYDGSLYDFEFLVPAYEDYYFYVYGDRPYVEIITPEPTTYDDGTITLTYIMTDYDGISACWFVLDGITVNLPVCGAAYVFDVDPGTHTLTLYGMDPYGNIGSDSVTFTVEEEVGPPPGPPKGSPGVPYYPKPPPVAPPPVVPPKPPVSFGIMEESIFILIDYPKRGEAEFSLRSNLNMSEVDCSVSGDFEEYTYIEISDTLDANVTQIGTIIVDMAPLEILDYDGGLRGVLECSGKADPEQVSSVVSNVYLIINKPVLQLENKTRELEAFELELREPINETLRLENLGGGNATAYSMTIEVFDEFRDLVSVVDYPGTLGPGEEGYVNILIDPRDAEGGVYDVPIDIYENGRFMTRGYIRIIIPFIPPFICYMPDLVWTLTILFLGLISAMIMYYKKRMLENVEMLERARKGLWETNKGPVKWATLTMLPFLLLWVNIVLAIILQSNCLYCFNPDVTWTYLIPIIGIFGTLLVYYRKRRISKELALQQSILTMTGFLLAWLLSIIIMALLGGCL